MSDRKTRMTPEQAMDKFYKCVVDATNTVNAKYGCGGVPFRRKEDGKTIMGVRYPDGHEDRYEVGAEYTQ